MSEMCWKSLSIDLFTTCCVGPCLRKCPHKREETCWAPQCGTHWNGSSEQWAQDLLIMYKASEALQGSLGARMGSWGTGLPGRKNNGLMWVLPEGPSRGDSLPRLQGVFVQAGSHREYQASLPWHISWPHLLWSPWAPGRWQKRLLKRSSQPTWLGQFLPYSLVCLRIALPHWSPLPTTSQLLEGFSIMFRLLSLLP